MPKVKIPRKSTNIDMTAMCDVAFLLLTFFMLTTKFKAEDPVVVDLPKSASVLKLPDANIISITVTESGKVYFGMDGKYNREKLITKLMQAHPQELGDLSEEDIRQFSLTSSFGVPIAELPTLLRKDANERNNPDIQKGIPLDSVKNELNEWVVLARVVALEKGIEEKKPEIFSGQRVIIRGDEKTPYPVVKKVLDILQNLSEAQLSVNKFQLVTDLRVVNK